MSRKRTQIPPLVYLLEPLITGLRTVTFQATVVSLPGQNPISNTANITFQYTPIAGGTTFNGLATSNSAGTQVNLADINGTKSVNKLLPILVKR